MNRIQLILQLENIKSLTQSAIEYAEESDFARLDRVLTDYIIPGAKDAANTAFGFSRMSGVGK